MSNDVIIIENLTKTFKPKGPPALNNISAVIPAGKIVGLIGPDGAGKTTLIRLIAGLLLPTSGKITVCGFDTVTQAQQIHNIIGYMPQRFGLYEDLSVLQNLNLYATLHGVMGEERKEIFAKLLKFTSLEPFLSRLARDLSGGMKQKLGLACTLVRTPQILLLDEPSVGVDPLSRRELWKMVQNLLEEGISVLCSTAYLDEADKMNSVILLNEGNMLYNGPPNNLTNRMHGRTFMIEDISGNRRQVLEKVLQDKAVLDGVIQGSDVRVVMKEGEASQIKDMHIDVPCKIEPTPPRFEDAFVDILGGGPGGFSVLAERTPKVVGGKGPAIVAKDLTRKFGSFIAVNDISFEVKRGEIFGLLGPNGAGKSTTFKMMCGLLKPTQGEAIVNGFDLDKASCQARSQIGYMAQKFSLYGNLSVEQNLDFFSGIYGLALLKQRQKIQEMVEVFNMKEYLNTNADELPLGYKQRLALSCAVMHEPSILFLDEPTSGVDPITRREFWTHINGLVEKGVTVMVTTHFMEEAEYCDRIALVYKGRIITMGTPDSLKQTAVTPETPNPTLEDAFIKLIQAYDEQNSQK